MALVGRTASIEHFTSEFEFPFIFFVNALDGIHFSFRLIALYNAVSCTGS